jgi:hypothetical protein
MRMSSPPFDRAQIEEHISLLHDLASGQDGVVVLATQEKGKTLRPQRFKIGDIEGMVNVIMGYENHPNINLYAPWAVMRRDLEHWKKGGINDVVAVLAAVGDLDNDKGKFSLDALPIPPPYVVESSTGNYQATYPFERPLSAIEAKAPLQALSDFIGGDSGIKDVNHPWRIPGTNNYPTTKSKLQRRGADPVPATIKQAFDGCFVSPKPLTALAPIKKPNGQDKPASSLSPAETSKLRDALKAIPADEREIWLKVGMALHLVQERNLWDEWSKTSDKFEDAEQDNSWDHFSADRDNTVTTKTIYWLAKQYGWRDTAKGEDIHTAPPAGTIVIMGNEIEPEAIDWIWNGFLARGMLHIFAGAPETGKTTLALAYAAIITAGMHWPDGTKANIGKVLIWTNEDHVAKTVIPRLIRMGADMANIGIVKGQRDENGKKRPFNPAIDMPSLTAAAREMECVEPRAWPFRSSGEGEWHHTRRGSSVVCRARNANPQRPNRGRRSPLASHGCRYCRRCNCVGRQVHS